MIHYRSGYKYQLHATYSIHVDIFPKEDKHTYYIDLSKEGLLTIRESYAWDGPSGPTIDTKSFLRGSLVHDALYQLIRMGRLEKSDRKQADKELYKICRKSGMSIVRAWYVYGMLRAFARSAVSKRKRKEVQHAP